MVRQRSMVSGSARRLGMLFAVVIVILGRAGDSRAQTSTEAIERLPYRIKAYVAIDPETRIDASRRQALLTEWSSMVRRFVGAPWNLKVAPESHDPAIDVDLDALDSDALAKQAEGLDKIWVIRVSSEGAGYRFSGREFDVPLHRLGPLHQRSAPFVSDAPRHLFQFGLDLFSPYALIGERFGKTVALKVRGAELVAASPAGRVVVEGGVFHPFRVVPAKGTKAVVKEIPFTYLLVESPDRAGATCSLVSVYPNPFTNQVLQKSYLVALGIKPGRSLTRLRFSLRPDNLPAAGYILTAKAYPDGLAREVGTTDREGRITLGPTLGDGLMIFRLLAGSSEPMREFPLMTGATSVERDVPPFDPKPLAVSLETRLDSLRDEVIDLVAVRARLEARLKARFDGEDWDGAEAILKEITTLPSRDKLAEQVTKLKENASRQQVEKKTPILTRTAQAKFSDLQALIERYLDDDLIRGYVDALSKVRAATQPKKTKAAAKK